MFTLTVLDSFYNIFASNDGLWLRQRQIFPMAVTQTLAEQGVVGSHTQKTKVAVLDVLTQPSLLFLIVDSVDSERKLASEDLGRKVCHEVLRVVKSHERLVMVKAQGTTNDGRVDALLKLSLRHVEVLLAHNPALSDSRGTEAEQRSEESRCHVVDGRVSNDKDIVRWVDPGGGVRAVGAESLANTTRVES